MTPLTERRREVISGPLTMALTELGVEHLPLAGAKAVNLAQIRNELGLPAPDGFAVTTAGQRRAVHTRPGPAGIRAVAH